MAGAGQKDLLSRLADTGEAAMKALADAPGAERFLGAVTTMRERVDELQRRVRGLESLEQRLAELERRVDELAGKGPSSRKTSGTKRKTAATKGNGATEASASRAKETGS
jgi:hypothetical protein